MLRPSRLRRRHPNVAPRLRKSGLRIDRSGAVTRRVDPRIEPTYEGDAHPIGWRGRRNLEARGADPLAVVATAGPGAATRRVAKRRTDQCSTPPDFGDGTRMSRRAFVSRGLRID